MLENLKLKALVIVCGMGLLLQGCSVSSTNQVVKPGENKGGFIGLSKNPEVMVDNVGTLKGHPSKVIIGSFKVGFLTDSKARATAKGGFFSPSASAGHATATVHLKGLTSADMQRMTNDIYQDFVKGLQGKGYTVVSAGELASETAYMELQDAGVASPEENVVLNLAPESKTTFVAPDGMKVVYFIGEKKAMFDMSMTTIQKSQALNEKTGATVLAVTYLVNFVGAETHGGFVSTASVSVGQGLRIGAGSVTAYNGKNKMPAVVKLGQPVFSEKKFCTIEKTTSAAAKTIGTAVNVATALLGGGTSQAETFEFNADPAAYTEAALEIGTKTNAKLVEKLAASK